MENRRGSGIFLGVVSVATLIVAIIGATFAYFSASTSSVENAVDATAYEFAVKVTNVELVNPVSDEEVESLGGIIPLNAGATVTGAPAGMNTNLLYALNHGNKDSEICVDDNGYQVCALYRVTLENSGTKDETLNLSVLTTKNEAGSGGEAFSDLTFQTLSGAAGTFATNGVAATLLGKDQSVLIKTSETANFTVTAVGPEEGEDSGVTVHYFVVYLNEESTNDDQSAQMGASYTGQLVYTTAAGGNRLTGTFTFSE